MDYIYTKPFLRDVAVPPANFDMWSIERKMAILIDVLIPAVLVLLWVLPKLVYRTDHICDEDDEIENGVVSQYKLWGFWVCGLDSIQIVDGIVTINKRRGRFCCSIQDLQFPVSSLVNMELKRRGYCSYGILWAFLVGCFLGTWFHFIPCIWWTCDWGYFDGQGVRGALWLVAWGILFFALVLFYPVIELEVTVGTEAGQTKYLLAIGSGSARSNEDAVACYDLETLKKCIYRPTKSSHGHQVSIVEVPKYKSEPGYQLT